ncbi:hypothetical protein BDV24DRAFT_157676 [Aspergillus arachidicola]|uniref:Xylanolytic transcriptional activator regulatory domain-containing protein n=1 Tax=Aspergillus arachidicola TaxID=656916 RepID=A0A5N6YPD2_9EURO|nr:hypothetical protein BDV24DRAFT_157676 [Aspergillus arachidicola]
MVSGHTSLSSEAVYLFNGFPFLAPEGRNWLLSHIDRENFPFSVSQWKPFQRTRSDEAPCASVESPYQLHRDVCLPPLLTVRQYIASYFSHGLCLALPVIDPSRFETTVSKAYATGRVTNTAELQAKICVLSFLCLQSLFQSSSDAKDLVIDGECISATVKSLISIVCQDMTLESLQICVMMSIYYFFTGDLHEASIWNALAIRINSFLDSNDYNLAEPTNQNRDTWLSPGTTTKVSGVLFWISYALDKELCLQTGRPSFINDDHYDLSLSFEYLKDFHMKESDFTMPQVVSHGTLLFYDLRLALIKSQIYDELYSARAKAKTDALILEDINSLIDTLEQWRVSFPPLLRPYPRIDTVETICANIEMRSIMIQLAYFDCVSVTYEANCRCRASPSQFLKVEEIGPSLNLAVEASRSSLRYLIAVRHSLVARYFWLLIFFPLRALSTVLLNILLHPCSSQTFEDVKLLKVATGFVRSLMCEHKSRSRGARMNSLDKYMEDLGRIMEYVTKKLLQKE